MRGQDRLARYAAPAAFLLAVTVAILLVRSGLDSGETAATPTAAATTELAPTTNEEPRSTGTGTTPLPAGGEFYVIEAGDTLAVIADEHDTTVEQLLVLNPDIDPVALSVGQRIRVK
ncbi:MAG TPA: LysM domain-containing protein [Gaiellaceae bacterium]|nr:LysM domain-containing protein [Gaiellaceae bacterium]